MAYTSFSRGVHVRLWLRQDSAPEGHWHLPPIEKHLFEHSAKGVVGTVGAQDEPSVRIHEVQTHRRTQTKCPRTPHTQHNTRHASTPAQKGQKAQETTHTTPHTERTRRRTGATKPRTRHKRHNTTSTRTTEQEPRGRGHRTQNTAQKACTPVNRSQGAQDAVRTTQHTGADTQVNRSQAAQDTAHTTPHTERAHR